VTKNHINKTITNNIKKQQPTQKNLLNIDNINTYNLKPANITETPKTIKTGSNPSSPAII